MQEPRRLWRRYLATNTAFLALTGRASACARRQPYAATPSAGSELQEGVMSEVFSGRVAVIGLGYIGLPTAVALATRGIEVIGVDVNPRHRRGGHRAGEVPFVEPDLAVGVSGAVAWAGSPRRRDAGGRRLHHRRADAVQRGPHGRPRPTSQAAAEQIAPRLRGGELVILESTSPPGTTEQVSRVDRRAAPRPQLPHDLGGRAGHLRRALPRAGAARAGS